MELHINPWMAAAVLFGLWAVVATVRASKRFGARARNAPGSDLEPIARQPDYHFLGGEDRAVMDAHLGIDIPLPSGKVVRCKCLLLKRGIYWSQMWDLAEAGHKEARDHIFYNFPREVAPPDDPDCFDELTRDEVIVLLDRFLAHRRPEVIRMINPAAKVEAPTEEDPDPATPPGAVTNSASAGTT